MAAPPGMAGIVRYYEEDKSKIKIKPEHVIGIGVTLVVLELILALVF